MTVQWCSQQQNFTPTTVVHTKDVQQAQLIVESHLKTISGSRACRDTFASVVAFVASTAFAALAWYAKNLDPNSAYRSYKLIGSSWLCVSFFCMGVDVALRARKQLQECERASQAIKATLSQRPPHQPVTLIEASQQLLEQQIGHAHSFASSSPAFASRTGSLHIVG
jgi:hypothetical protein